MEKRLQGKFVTCPYHDDDYEACIEYSGQAPCDPPDGWQMVPIEATSEMLTAGAAKAMWSASNPGLMAEAIWQDMLASAPRRNDHD